jgi:hypothetical protein
MRQGGQGNVFAAFFLGKRPNSGQLQHFDFTPNRFDESRRKSTDPKQLRAPP